MYNNLCIIQISKQGSRKMENITTFKQLREKVKRKLNERGMTFIDLSFGIKRPYRYIHDVLSGRYRKM